MHGRVALWYLVKCFMLERSIVILVLLEVGFKNTRN